MIDRPPSSTPEPAVRAQLRSALRDLSVALTARRGREFLDQTIRSALILAEVARETGPVRLLLLGLQGELRNGRVDSSYYSAQLTLAADRI